MAAPASPVADDTAERFALIEMDAPAAPVVKPAAAPVAAPTVTVAPVTVSLLVEGRALFASVANEAALDDAARSMAARCIAAHGDDKQHPTRVALREHYLARKVEIQRAAWLAMLAALWLRIWASLARGVDIRPHLVVRPVVTPEPVTEPTGLSLTQSLAIMTAPVTGTSSGSLAAGTMRGVGFPDAAGYVTALANGTKEPTTSQYLSILRSQYGYTEEQIAGLSLGGIAQSELPAGKGIAADHRVDGKDVFDLRREAAAAAAKTIRETADATTLALAQRLTVADSPNAWWEIGWRGVGSITRAELVAATGDEMLAPEPKISSTQLSRTIDSLRGTHDATMVTTRPVGVKVRWQIGRGKQHAAYVGAEYGKVLAIVDLCSDNTLVFDGDVTIADEVRAEYSRFCGDEVLRPGDVTSWLQQTLRKRFGAVRSGERFLLSPKHKDAARELCSKVASVWSVGNWVRGRLDDDGVPELGVTYQDVATVIGGIWQGLAAEVTEAEERWAKTVTDAAAKTQKPGVRACTNELERIDGAKPEDGLVARVNGLRIIGEGPLAPLRARVAALRAAVTAALREANDPTSERFANLELT
jgi:hypothetical protein